MRVARLMRSRFLILSLSVLVTLALAELATAVLFRDLGSRIHFAAKQTGCCQLDPELIWRFRAGVSGTWITEEFVESTTINSLGMRDEEVPGKPPDEFRIVALGDSFTYGHGVQLVESYPKVLESFLRAERATLRVINCGQPGYGLDQTYKLALQAQRLDLDPDLVLIGLQPTDTTLDVDKSLYTI